MSVTYAIRDITAVDALLSFMPSAPPVDCSICLTTAYDLRRQGRHAEAHVFLNISIDAGNARAAFEKAMAQKNGGWTLGKNPAASVALFRRAAAMGSGPAIATLWLMYKDMREDDKPRLTGDDLLHWEHMAFSSEDPLARGLCFYHGIGCNVDKERAYREFVKAGNGGDAIAQVWVGILLAKGHGVERDNVQSFEWHKRSAEAGYYPAQVNLSTMYEHGIGTPVNSHLAGIWLDRANGQSYK